jgi:FkbM family methyltransferase
VSKWYHDADLVKGLPLRYRVYASYSRFLGDRESRHVKGGSFLLRLIRDASSMVGTSTIARVHGIDGLTVVTDFADERVLEVIHEIRGENPEYRVMKALLSEGGTFVDVGANFGTFSLLASRLVGKSGKVIAIEPQERLASLIEESAGLSGATNIEVHRVACGSVNGEKELLIPEDDSGRAGFFAGFSGRKKHVAQRVPVTTLDWMLRDTPAERSYVIKIDVEGSEMEVLTGAAQIIESRKPPIIIELNPWSFAAAGTTTRKVVDRLASLGYNRFSESSSYPASVEIPMDKQVNIIAEVA